MSNLKERLKNSQSPMINCLKKIYHSLVTIKTFIQNQFYVVCYYICRLSPIDKNKIIVSSFNGKKYGDNCQYIAEELLKLNPNLDIVWMKDDDFYYDVPPEIRTLSLWNNNFKKVYEYSTAKVWIDTHRLDCQKRKRKNQLFIETWHGGLGIKKLDGDVPKFCKDKKIMREVKNTSDSADIFISNSNHLTKIYRSAFKYKGKIWKCGYPKNDILFCNNENIKQKVKKYYNIKDDFNILVYAPTFRDDFYGKGVNTSVYDINFPELFKSVTDKFGGNWVIMVKYHPILVNQPELYNDKYEYVINATKYPEMQEIVIAADVFISDYSSCIFDAAIRDIPCFTFAVDFEEYKGDRGVYYEMEELPFPYARDNDQLAYNIRNFDYKDYLSKWEGFKKRTGLHETGHAARDVAYLINEYIKGNEKPLEEIKNEL